MDSTDPIKYKSIINDYLSEKEDVLKITVTDATTDIALTFLYRVLCDRVFGENQLVFISLFEFQEKSLFLESTAIELTSFNPEVLYGISYGHDPSIQFKDADVVICIGLAREYEFEQDEYKDPFFKDHILTSRYYGKIIEDYAKRDVRIIVIGNTAATIIAKYLTSIPLNHVTSSSMFNLNTVTAYIASYAKCLPTEVRNVIIWGTNNKNHFPDCRYMFFANGKNLSNRHKAWIKHNLLEIMPNILGRPSCVKSMAYGLAEHCRVLWNGTPENEWTSMSVMSDDSYDVPSTTFFSFPVICKDRNYEIVQGIENDEFTKFRIRRISKLVGREVNVGIAICEINEQDIQGY